MILSTHGIFLQSATTLRDGKTVNLASDIPMRVLSDKRELASDCWRNMVLTKEIMPNLARTSHRHWPVRNDHCFQRIVLDAVCGGVWYDHLLRPAYKNLTHDQAANAVDLCNDIISGDTDLVVLNKQSLK